MATEKGPDVRGLGRATDAEAGLPPAQAKPGIRYMFSSLQNRDYRWLWTGTVIFFAAQQMQIVARGWLVYDMTGSAKALGLVTTASGLPMVLVSLIGGVAADRVDKRRLLMASQMVVGVATLGQAILIVTHTVQLWHLMVAALITGAAFSFNMPARQALVPELVGENQLMNAIALNSAGSNLTRIVSPAIAGVLIGVIGVSGVYFVMVAGYALVVASVYRVSAGDPVPTIDRPSMAAQLGQGFSYIAGNSVVKWLLIQAVVFLPLAMQLQLLMPVFAVKVFHMGASGYGTLLSSLGIGGLIGSMTVASLTEFRRKGVLLLTTGAIYGGLTALFAVISLGGNSLIGMSFLVLVGIANMAFMATNNTILMTQSDPSMRGRVMAVYLMGFGLQPLLAVPSGALADAIGAPQTMIFAGSLMAAVTLFMAARPHIRNA